jgi:ankyrin repeat protein
MDASPTSRLRGAKAASNNNNKTAQTLADLSNLSYWIGMLNFNKPADQKPTESYNVPTEFNSTNATNKSLNITFINAVRSNNILQAITQRNNENLVRELVFGVHSNLQNEYGWSPLMIAVLTKNFQALKLLLQMNANVDLTDNDGVTPLMIAAGRVSLYNLFENL